MSFVFLATTSREDLARMRASGTTYPHKPLQSDQGTKDQIPIKKPLLADEEQIRYLVLKAFGISPEKYAVDCVIQEMEEKWILPEYQEPVLESMPKSKDLFSLLSAFLAANSPQDIKGKRKADHVSPVTAFLTELFESQRYARLLEDNYGNQNPSENEFIPTICLSGPPVSCTRENAPLPTLCEKRFGDILVQHKKSLDRIKWSFPKLYEAMPEWMRYAGLIDKLRNESPEEVDAVLAQYQDVFPCCVVDRREESESSCPPSPRRSSSNSRKSKSKANTCSEISKDVIQTNMPQSLHELIITIRHAVLSNLTLFLSILYLLIRWYLRGIT